VFKWVLSAALIVSIGVCAVTDVYYYRLAEEREELIASKRAQLRPLLQPIANEVIDFQRQKTSLQKRIDAINELKQNQVSPAAVLAKMTTLDPRSVDSVAVVGNDLVVNRK
jgi:hypothetical protein